MQIVIRSSKHFEEFDSLSNIFLMIKGVSDTLEYLIDDNMNRNCISNCSETSHSPNIRDGVKCGDKRTVQEPSTNAIITGSTVFTIHIKHEEEQCIISVEKLDTYRRVPVSLLSQHLNEIVAALVGYIPISLKGLRVKDASGNKIKPIIDIYVKADLRYKMPRSFEFTKEVIQMKDMMQPKLKMYTSSTMLNSLIEKGGLCFQHGDLRIRIESKNGKLIATLLGFKIASIVDALTYTTVLQDIRRILEAESMHFSSLLRTILFEDCNTENVKNFFKKISKGLKDAEYKYLAEIVTRFPMLHDSRNLFIANLENFLNISSQPLQKTKCDYLEVTRQRHLKTNCKFNLKKFAS